MPQKSDFLNIAQDAATQPIAGKIVAQGAGALGGGGLGFSVYLGYFEKGVGLAAAVMGLLVTIALWRKLRLERREVELRVQDLERRRNLPPSD